MTNLKYHLFILGCQMNHSDGERIAAVLNSIGYTQTDDENEADLIIVVACSVRQSAIDRIYGKIKNWHKLKETKPLITAVTGCLLPKDKQLMEQKFDLAFDISELSELPAMLKANKNEFKNIKNYFNIHPVPKSSFQVYIPIMTGCNNFCTYCAVPYTRGREKSRSSQDILKEVQSYIDKGYKEITLLGQNVNSYGNDLKNEIKFPELLKKVNDLQGNFWLRFLTSHPKDMSDELIEVMREGEKICEYLHLPVQAGDDKVLKRMNRKYTIKHYKGLIKKVRKAIPGITITTDTIVGFPSETRWQFNKTKRLYKQMAYDMAYIGKYSPRSGTVSATWEDNITLEEKKRRERILTKIMEKSALKHNKKLLNKTETILVEEYDGKYIIGKTRSGRPAKALSKKDLTGEFVDIIISSVHAYSLSGKIKGAND
ncbi:MAG: tRNA (N6-isopentenyl adenosine(37)-C2)-methylthiotransferase MiaB [Candidatus Komeilibacteria bacterium]